MIEFLLLLLAGVLGGMANSIAGGGSFITFPALLLAGVAPISANATNTFASCAGYLSGTYAFRDDLRRCAHELPRIIALSLAGGITGAWLLLQTPDRTFRAAIPWLMLLATLLFIFGGRLNALLRRSAAGFRHARHLARALLAMLLLAISVYGGFFNAGLGIIVLSYLALAGYTDISAMNGIKLLVSSAVSLIAIGVFLLDGVIAWYQGSAVLLGTLLGGYLAARWSRAIAPSRVRAAVIATGMVVTAYFFITA